MQGGGRPYIATSSLGAHGLPVNLDLPARHGVSTPRNGKAFLAACETFRAKGIIPISADREALKNRSDRREPDAARRPHTGKRRRLSRRAQCLPGSAGAGELPQGRQLRYGTGLCFCPAHARREVHRAFAQSGRHTLTSLTWHTHPVPSFRNVPCIPARVTQRAPCPACGRSGGRDSNISMVFFYLLSGTIRKELLMAIRSRRTSFRAGPRKAA